MVDIHLILPDGVKPPELDKVKILDTFVSRNTKSRLYIISVTEEEYTFFKLKYGSENVWKR